MFKNFGKLIFDILNFAEQNHLFNNNQPGFGTTDSCIYLVAFCWTYQNYLIMANLMVFFTNFKLKE